MDNTTLDMQNAEAHQGEQVCFISICTCDLDMNLISPPTTRKVPLTTGDDIVKPFHLPKDQHTVLPLSLHSSAGDDDTGINEAVPERSGVAVSYTHPHDSPFIPPEMCRWERYPLTCLLGGVMQCLSQCMSWPKTT
jgi:xeroderma pigmentosum group C-complementing protein